MKRWLALLFVLLAAAAPQSRGYAQVLEEHVSLNSQPATLNRVYNYGLDLISQRDAGGTVYYFIYDGLGSTRLLTTTNGAVANVFAYDAYGTLIASNGSPQTVYLYCGEQFDPQLGFYYLRARYLNTGTGRFWTRDTHPGQLQEPLSLHRYLYVSAGPVNRVDPSGNTGFIQTLTVKSIQLGFFTARWAAQNPKKTFVVVAALSATGIFDGFPPGHPTPFDELATFGRMIRGTGSVVRDTAAVARYQAALSVRAFFSKFWRHDYKKTFFEAFPELEGKVWVHRAVEHQALMKYPGVVTEAEINSLANLRGIPNAVNPDIHLSEIRTLWNRFYESHPTATKEQLLEHARRIDDLFGHLFDPPIRQ